MIPCKRLRFTHLFCRSKGSLGLWQEDINTEIKQRIEKYWSNEVMTSIQRQKQNNCYYVLPMFPYPSGNLHMGHVRVYSLSDTIARFQKLSGKNVIHPVGWDAFGLPAENAAIERNIPPDCWTSDNIASMKNQLLQMGFQFDWDRELSTCDPKYYKWTQYIFLKLFENGLAYQSKANVNWDPIDKTVLADEQVDDLGRSWRSGAMVEKKNLTQWFIRTTKYAKKLYEGLDSKFLENWKDIINLQKHWIGECNGVVVTFQIKVNGKTNFLDIWTSAPYKFIYGSFLTIHSNNIILQDVSGSTTNLKMVNPLTDSELPVYITDDVEYPEGRDVYIASPQFDEKDRIIAESLNIASPIQNSSTINIEIENQRAIKLAQDKNIGGHLVSSKLKDWLISRQRYWGTPIPIVHCSKCGIVPVPYEELPVKLPASSSMAAGIQTLSKLSNWVNCKCPKCKLDAQRETDTMDTFVDSSWYYYRFLDPGNNEMPFDKDKLIGNTPVHVYVGGKEHAVLHLYYARFMSYFLNSLGWTISEEPFKKLLVQGMVMGQSYRLKCSGKYLHPDTVEKVEKQYREKGTGEPVLVQWEKMSKSKHNGENPEKLIATYGCDTTKLLMLADVPPATPRQWSDATLPGVLNWQHRLWITIREFLKYRNDASNIGISEEEFKKHEEKIKDSRNYFIATATYHFKYTQKISVGISRLQSLTNTLRNKVPPEVIAKSKEFEIAIAYLIIMLAPVTPHFCSELWAGFISAPHRLNEDCEEFIKWDKDVLDQRWPKVDDDYELSFQCKVSETDRLCHECVCLVIMEAANRVEDPNYQPRRQVGHECVCICCGISLIQRSGRRRYRLLPMSDERAYIENYIFPRQVPEIAWTCNACWMRARDNRPIQVEVPAVAPIDHWFDAVQNIEPQVTSSSGPSFQPSSESDSWAGDQIQNPQPNQGTIELSNYRRTSDTPNRCFVPDCMNEERQRVPMFLKRAILKGQKIYIADNARVCLSHSTVFNWDMLNDYNTFINTFTATHINGMLELLSSIPTNSTLNFESINNVSDTICHYWTGLTKANFIALFNSVPELEGLCKKAKTALGLYLVKLRTGEPMVRLASLFVLNKGTVITYIRKVRNCLSEHFVPMHLGINHMTRPDHSARNLLIPQGLFGTEENNPIVICDGTYIYIQKSSNYLFQKETWSLHKYQNLVKPFLMVATDGHIIDAFGPYAATKSDADIVNSLFGNSDSPLRSYFRRNDVFILDRGFRDAIGLLNSLGYTVQKPESLETGETQLSTIKANKSRLVTMCRWVVEVVNGRYKRDFKLFRNKYFNTYSRNLMPDFRIASALLNKFHPVLTDHPDAQTILNRALSRLEMPNTLADDVLSRRINRDRINFMRIDAQLPELHVFPVMEMRDLILFGLGTYQIKQARSYYGEHIRQNGTFQIEVDTNLTRFDENQVLLRGKISSRHVSSRKYFTYILLNLNGEDWSQRIEQYYCSCIIGKRTVGSCAHVMTMVWYLGWARHQESILPPASFLDGILIREDVD